MSDKKNFEERKLVKAQVGDLSRCHSSRAARAHTSRHIAVCVSLVAQTTVLGGLIHLDYDQSTPPRKG